MKIKTESELEELLSRPDEETASAMAALDGDLLILGAGGKMGPSLARLARRAIDQAGVKKRVIAVARFTNSNLPSELAAEGIEVEVVDPRSLKPLDTETIIRSVSKTGRVLIAHEAPVTGGFGGELAAVIAGSEAFDYLDAPIRRLAGRNVPIPYNRNLERAAVPQVEDSVAAARALAQEGL